MVLAPAMICSLATNDVIKAALFRWVDAPA